MHVQRHNERVGESDDDDDDDENTPINDENAFLHSTYAPVHRSSSVLALRTPLSHSRTDHDTALRDITDQFFHPPSPSPVRISKPVRSALHAIEPPRRPRKPKSLAYPADPPNWLCSRSSSTLPPSSPLPPSDRSVGAPTTARYEYHLGTPSNTSDSDPFGFVAAERALKTKRVRVPHKPTSRISAVKSPPRSTVLPSAPSRAPVFASFSQLDAPVPTNNEDIDGLYTDEPAAGPSHAHVDVAPLLMMNSDQPFAEMDATGSQPDPLRTPRKRKRRASPTPGGDPDSDSDGTSIPSSPSPVKVSVGMNSNRRPGTARAGDPSLLKVTRTRAQSRVVGTSNVPTTHTSVTKCVKKSYQDIPTPSSTPSARRSSRHSTAPPTPIPPRRSTRQAAVGARAKLNGTTNDEQDGHGGGRMKLRSRSRDTKVATETKTTKTTARVKHPSVKSKTRSSTQKVTTPAKPMRGRPKGKASTKNSKGKGKARPLESVLDLSDDTRERYEQERRERLEYFKRLEGYQIQKENVYVV